MRIDRLYISAGFHLFYFIYLFIELHYWPKIQNYKYKKSQQKEWDEQVQTHL